MDVVIPAGLKEIGAVGLVALFFLLFYFGKVVPRRTVDEIIRQADARVVRAESETGEWREAHALTDLANRVLIDQNRELIELARTSDHLLKSIHTVATGEVHPAALNWQISHRKAAEGLPGAHDG